VCLCLSVLLAQACIPGLDEALDCPPLSDTSTPALEAWFAQKCYVEWDAESGVLPATMSDGHAQIFINPTLRDSLVERGAIHPLGSAAVRVIYMTDKQTVWGYALSLKTTDGAGAGWFWYERFVNTEAPKTATLGASGCTGCHASGVDFVQSSWPLR
jgi:hypothetical protein